jgi:4-carboxymuconolactone decarboxylase
MRLIGEMMTDLNSLFAQMMEQGQKLAQSAMLKGVDISAIFPPLSAQAAEAWFGKTHNPQGLDARTRTLCTLTGLIVQGNATLIKPTISQALTLGATKQEISEVILQTSLFGGLPAMQQALEIAQSLFAETEEPRP